MGQLLVSRPVRLRSRLGTTHHSGIIAAIRCGGKVFSRCDSPEFEGAQTRELVPATSRFNVAVGSIVVIGYGDRFGALIDSTMPIAVERALYSDAQGVFWAAGTNATATKIP